MSRIIQYSVFPASDLFVNNRAHFAPAMEKIATIDGHISSFWGLQVEEEGAKMGYLITVWESAEQRQKFMEGNSVIYTSLLANLDEAVAPSGELVRYQFSAVKGSPVPGFEAKTTEIAIATAKSGASQDDIKNAAIKVGDILNAHGHPAALGESVDGSGIYIIVIGWESEAESRTTIKSEPYVTSIDAFNSIASLERSHAHIDKH